MGIFYEQTEVINRTCNPLNVRFDGQDIEIPPNYDEAGQLMPDVHNMIPTLVVPYALNQSVIMGSEDASDPSSFGSKIGIPLRRKDQKPKSWNECSFVPEETEPNINTLTRVPIEDQLDDPSAKVVVRGNKKRKGSDHALGVSTAPFDFKN